MAEQLPDGLRKHLARANQYKKENKKYLLNLARKKDVDDTFHTLHDEAFEQIDCLT